MTPIHSFLAVLVAVLWGFNFVAIEVGLGEFPPLLFAALRFVVIAFPAVLFVPRGTMPWRWIGAVGLAMGVFQFGFLYIGMAQGMPPDCHLWWCNPKHCSPWCSPQCCCGMCPGGSNGWGWG
jgi:O-acetylserine/cysteine efflux transporter